ncbi:efflux RND transporter permease subunit, partial [Anaerorhabdus sp.]|uniref:efflux RND transporter permease subunit n=1 Tax=Anaerorhabdus sp. TaxID=1872524 RepID=UPI002B217E43
MFSKFSVKKPYTVIVGVVMVLLLGFISFTSSTTDLLPKMELPYVVVYTSYPGASAEKVETSLTKVLESSIGTTENLVNMSSVSSDNLSLIILQFADDTNMDSAMINLNAKVDLVKGYLDSSVSTPTLMAINPNMMPIMMATIDYEGQDLKSLSEFVDSKVVPELEKTKGVATVTPQGLLEETVQIVLDQDKIDDINNKILNSVDSELAKAERDLLDSLKQVNDGLVKINDGQATLNSTKTETVEQLAQTSVQLQQAATNLIAMDSQVTQLKAEKIAFQTIVDSYDAAIAAIGMTGSTSAEVIVKVNSDIATVQAGLNTLTQAKNTLTIILSGLPTDDTLLLDQATVDALAPFSIILTTSDTVLKAKELINNQLPVYTAQIDSANSILANLNNLLMLASKVDDARVKLSNVDIEIATAEGVKQAASAMLVKAGIDVSDLTKLQVQLESGKITAGGEFTKGEITLTNSKASLESAKV